LAVSGSIILYNYISPAAVKEKKLAEILGIDEPLAGL